MSEKGKFSKNSPCLQNLVPNETKYVVKSVKNINYYISQNILIDYCPTGSYVSVVDHRGIYRYKSSRR